MGLLSAARHVRRARQLVSVEPLESRRLLSSGDLDPTFGAGGKVTTDFPGSANDRGYDLVVQPDGKYVVAGSTTSSAGYSEDAGFAFARYNPDGSLDPTFGDGGKVVVPFGRFGTAAAAALAPGGKIVAVGTTTGLNGTPGGGQNFAVVRLNPDGTPDTTFDGDGRQTIDFDGRSDSAGDVVVLGDGRIVVLGRAEEPGSRGARDNALARLRPDGSLDPSFDGDGRAYLKLPAGSFRAAALATDGAGAIYAAGSQPDGPDQTGSGFVLVRLLGDASGAAIDPAFAGGGIAYTPLGSNGANLTGAVVDGQGRIVLAGTVYVPPDGGRQVAVARYLPDGSADASFGGGDGVATFGPGVRYDTADGLAVDASGNIVVAGRIDPAGGVGTGNAAVFRFDPTGAPDLSFDGDGSWMGATAWSEARAVAAAPGGGIVVAGVTRPDFEDYEFLLARLDAAGRPDAAFGAGGEVTTDFVGYTRNEANSMVVQPDGKVVVGGTTDLADNEWWTFTIVRYASDGSLDPSFGSGGRAAAVPGLRKGSLYALALQPDGRIAAAGQAWDAAARNGSGMWVVAVARFTADGAPDPSFGQGGKVTFEFGVVDGWGGSARAVAIQDDGRILVGVDVGGDFAVARLTAAGALDTTFGTGGKAVAGIGTPGPWGRSGYVTAMGLGPGGTITVAGPTMSDVVVSSTFGVARFDASGRLDPTFGEGGKIEIGVAGSCDDVKLLVMPDGGTVIGTTTMAYSQDTGWSDRDFALLRLLPDGSRDDHFGGYRPGPDGTDPDGGVVTVDFTGGDDVLHALVLLPDGTFVAAGSADSDAGAGDFFFDYDRPRSDFALVQINADGTSHNQFGDAAKVTTDFGGYEDVAQALALGPGGALIAAGTAVVPGNATDFAVARYTVDLTPPPPGRWVRAAFVFYNNSAFDGHDAGAGEADDGAIATDKVPLLPGETATSSNVTNYSAGINGVMMDLGFDQGLTFAWWGRVADAAAPGGWREAPGADIETRSIPNGRGSVRETFVWPDGAIRNTWLELTVVVYVGNTPVEQDTFTFGNLVGETGDDGRVNALDLGQVKRLLNRPAAVDSPVDFNRDGRVNALDLGIAKRSLNRTLAAPPLAFAAPALALPPLGAPAAEGGVAAALLRESEPGAQSPLL
jgi:uncharacterized delta-60 repeat protein